MLKILLTLFERLNSLHMGRQALTTQAEYERLKLAMAAVRAASEVMSNDVRRVLEPPSTYAVDEEGRDAWRNQVVALTLKRLLTISEACTSGEALDLAMRLWDPAPSEEEVYVKQLLANRSLSRTRKQWKLLLLIVSQLDQQAIEGVWPRERCRFCYGSSGTPAAKPEFSHASSCIVPLIQQLREVNYSVEKEGEYAVS